jgi:hypothetical protein
MGAWLDPNDNEVIQTWEKELGREVRARDPLFDPAYGFAGSSDTNLIQL